MPECMICHQTFTWTAWDSRLHMLPPYTIDQVQSQLREKSFTPIQFEPKPDSVLIRGRKRGLKARDGGPCSTLF